MKKTENAHCTFLSTLPSLCTEAAHQHTRLAAVLGHSQHTGTNGVFGGLYAGCIWW